MIDLVCQQIPKCVVRNADSAKDGIAVTLDRRPLKTPSGNTLILPHGKRLAAALIASEWENQDKVLKPHTLPMVRQAGIRASCWVCDVYTDKSRQQSY